MKPQLLLSLLLAALLPMTASAQSGEGEFPDLFNTSAAYDILAVFPQADKLAEDPFFTGTLGADTLFLDRAHRIDSVVRPSQLCNLYSLSGGSKDDPEQVVEFFASFDPESLPQKVRGAWMIFPLNLYGSSLKSMGNVVCNMIEIRHQELEEVDTDRDERHRSFSVGFGFETAVASGVV